MPLLSTNNLRIFFAHVPKTGGSSVEDYLVRRFSVRLSLFMVAPLSKRKFPGLVTAAHHMTSEDLVDFLPSDLDHSFAVVRDPVERLFSQYRFQAKKSRTANLSFSTWLRVMMHCVRIDPRAYGNHLRPQSDLVPEASEIFHFEDGFDKVIAWLDGIIGTSAPELTMGHLGKGAQSKIQVTQQDVQLIEEYYAVDYERFGYPHRDTSELRQDSIASARDLLAAALAPVIILKQRRRWLR